MSVYETIKCCYCNDRWKDMEMGRSSAIGPPFIKCRKCGGLNKTKRVLYRDASSWRKFRVLTNYGFQTFFYGGLGLVVTWQMFVRLDGWWKLLGIAALAFSLQQWYYLFFGMKKDIIKMEEIFDKNGGFVWSDQAY